MTSLAVHAFNGFHGNVAMFAPVVADIPPPRRRTEWPYETLAIGSSFFMADANPQTAFNLNNRWGKKLGCKFAARKERNGVRVWRTE